jgi:hypothetical protein
MNQAESIRMQGSDFKTVVACPKAAKVVLYEQIRRFVELRWSSCTRHHALLNDLG